jgi:triosephosphate isomerase
MWGCLCVGEEVRDKKYKQAIRAQLKASLSKTKAANLKTLCLAYEPVWAIGKDAKRPATPAEIEETVAYIYEVLAELYPSKGNKLTKDIIVLYGGSVDKSNMKDILNIQNVGGLLIGRASSDKKSWKGLLDGFLK